MLFNSIEFVFFFFPATLAGFFLFGRRTAGMALAWLIVSSIVFYAWWRPLNVLIIAPSIAINYAIARTLVRLPADRRGAAWSNAVLALGIAFNVAFLGYFKYVNFLATVANDVAGTNFVFEQVMLPLGISFITFQKIAFLVDVHARRIEVFTLREYMLFVFFFPQLIAGPIVHYREMMPQFRAATCRFDREHVAVGLTLFIFGLFKKVVLADGIAARVSPIYAMAAAGEQVSLLPAWIAAFGFTLQIYFDFSGYSDMAMGLARCFGVRLPANFDSPLKARNIIDFWLRWHITLTRFLTAYLYNPVALALTRRRMARGLAPLRPRKFDGGAFLHLLALPTLLTMLVSGVWHGAGYTFMLWGLLHGVYLVVNHAWRQAVVARMPDKARYERVMGPVGWVLTLLSVAVAMVLFRADSVSAAAELLQGMFGGNGVRLPPAIADALARATGGLPAWLGTSNELTGRGLVVGGAWVAALLGLALAAPNSLQVLARYEPALLAGAAPGRGGVMLRTLQWRPTAAWAAGLSVVAVIAVGRIGAKSEFLYWQF
ncbi:MAG: MBOAT family protein [Ideonella sp.]|nr:MBOAT family protein [Ideonella sp.]